MVSNTLTAESTHEQGKAGPDRLHARGVCAHPELNADYNASSAFPSSWPCAGPRGTGLSKREIIATFARRLHNHPDFELAECLRNIHRIAEIRLNDKFGVEPVLGNRSGTGRSPGPAQRPRLCRERASSRSPTSPTPTAPAPSASAQLDARCGFDEVTSMRSATWWALPGTARRPRTADRQPLRHRAQRRQVRRPAGHLRAHGLRAANCTGKAGACPSASRWSALPKKKASATRPPSWARAR
jgi:hypothetical protein